MDKALYAAKVAKRQKGVLTNRTTGDMTRVDSGHASANEQAQKGRRTCLFSESESPDERLSLFVFGPVIAVAVVYKLGRKDINKRPISQYPQQKRAKNGSIVSRAKGNAISFCVHPCPPFLPSSSCIFLLLTCPPPLIKPREG